MAGSRAVLVRRRRSLALGAAVGAALVAALAGCGSSRTHIPDRLGTTVPGQPLLPNSAGAARSSTPALATLGSVTTTTPYQTAGIKYTLPSAVTVVVSYPNTTPKAPKDVAPPPTGSTYAVLTARLCAAKTAPLPPDLVDPDRFSVEVPGQGLVAHNSSFPTLKTPALMKGAAAAAGACVEGAISFVIGGEHHISSIVYDAGDGLYRWAS